MKLHNSLTKQTEEFSATSENIGIYSCGPTVYDNLHIGNLSSFIYADILRRTVAKSFPEHQVKHVMNITDVDDKTIRDSTGKDADPMQALINHTRKYEQVFMEDMKKVGNDTDSMEFIRATDSIEEMLSLIRELYEHDFAYIAEDGVYFSIEKYKAIGKTYGQLVHIDESSNSSSRIQNDEYDKDSAHDFALWKVAKNGEPSWIFELDGHTLDGRPGWHIECSAMSHKLLGVPFDIHTGGIDLKFPHHENEIAQSTACSDSPTMARLFFHNEHILVDGTKMSKSLGNFYTLRDIEERGYSPLIFRMLVLQGHYRNATNFSWENLEAAKNRLDNWRRYAALRHQPLDIQPASNFSFADSFSSVLSALKDDLNTAKALSAIDEVLDHAEHGLSANHIDEFVGFLSDVDSLLGLSILTTTPDIGEEEKQLLNQRKEARDAKDWSRSDAIRDELRSRSIEINDSKNGQLWHWG